VLVAILSGIEREFLVLRVLSETEVTIVLQSLCSCPASHKGSTFRESGRAERGRPNFFFGGKNLRLSNLDNVFYSAAGFTKRDVIDYAVTSIPFSHFDALTLVEVR